MSKKLSVEILELVFVQYEMVRFQDRFNMNDRTGVQFAASEMECHELVCFIEDHGSEGYGVLLESFGDWKAGKTEEELAAIHEGIPESDDWDEEGDG